MIARWRWMLTRLTKRLWVRASLFSLLGVATALLAIVFKDSIPAALPARIGADAVDKILSIIASSMLAVTTFSLSTMVSAYSAASSGVTPRATTLVMEDTTTQNALATFIGSFLFSLVGIIALSTGAYGAQGRVMLFAVTLAVVMLIVYTLLRWIAHLSKLGRVGETIDRVEAATIAALEHRARWPFLGGAPYPADLRLANTAVALTSPVTGYVQHIDVQALEDVANEHGLNIYVDVLPGSFVHLGMSLARIVPVGLEQEQTLPMQAIVAAMTIGVRRTFEHDPRFGLAVLSEIASRALSPAVNDPGTAIDVLGRGVRSLTTWARPQPLEAGRPEAESAVFLQGLTVDDLFDDFFAPIARDGAGLLEVDLRMAKALGSLVQVHPQLFGGAARKHARWLSERAAGALTLEADQQRLGHCLATLGLLSEPLLFAQRDR